jgi:pSer/pThr/pTyr-binding forkhead associated (FHA) protein
MFALEISFADDTASAETIFIRRPTAVVGAESSAHVLVDDMAPLRYSLQISREIERTFRLRPIAADPSVQLPSFLEGTYDGQAVVDLGPVKMRFTALDTDLLLKEGETPDRAGMRILRQSAVGRGPRFPAIVVQTNPKATISFTPDQPLYVGRSRQCSLRLDVLSVSAKHARIGFESGEFWVEDLGSTNGTFVNQQQISGRVNVAPEASISLGKEITLVGVTSQDQLMRASTASRSKIIAPVVQEKKYPVLVSLSESARPARIVLAPGSKFSLGRDPTSDMWLGAPHISRRHCLVEMTKSGVVRITDQSTNGTAYDKGMLRKNETAETTERPYVLDFGGNVTVAVCFTEGEEKAFVAAAGSPQTFLPQVGDFSGQVGRGSRRTTTWLRDVTPDAVAKQNESSRKGALGGMYGDLSRRGRLAMTLVGLGILAVIVVVGALLVSGLRW